MPAIVALVLAALLFVATNATVDFVKITEPEGATMCSMSFVTPPMAEQPYTTLHLAPEQFRLVTFVAFKTQSAFMTFCDHVLPRRLAECNWDTQQVRLLRL